MPKLIVICQSRGKFVLTDDGGLSYSGGEAHALSISRESKFDNFRAEMAEFWKYDPNAITVKYFVPHNNKTLITVSSDKDLQRLLDFHEDSSTVDAYVLTNEEAGAEIPVSPPTGEPPASKGTEQPVVNAEPLETQPGSPLNVTPVASCVAGGPQMSCVVPYDVVGEQKLQKVWEGCITGLHQQFNNVAEVREALRRYSLAQGFSIKFKNNDATRVNARCKAEGCSWRIYVSKLTTTNFFRTKKFIDKHTCGAGTGSASRPHASRKLVATIVKEKMLSTPNFKPKEIAKEIQEEFGIELRYYQAWRGMEAARQELQGSFKDSYNLLPWLREKLLETNPGSFVSLITSDDLTFRGFFVCMHSSISGFENGCRPLVFLDEMTVRSKYQSELLTATALDGNDGIFPLAFAVVDAVNEKSWQWFLEQLKSALTTTEAITFVADRLMGLRQSIPMVFQNSYHGFCVRRLSDELLKDLSGVICTQEVADVLMGHMYDAAQAATREGFLKSLDKIKSISPEAWDWIIRSEPEHWANYLFVGSRYNQITSGVAESFYSWVPEIQLPVVQFVDTIRQKMMELIYTRKVEADQWVSKVTPSLEDKLQREVMKAQSLQVFPSTTAENTFEVRDYFGSFNHTVNVDTWSCSCRDWRHNGYPCSHAVAVLQGIGTDPYDYCAKYYTTETFRMTYGVPINPVATTDKPVHDASTPIQVQPPALVRVSGRPKDRRIRKRGVIKRTLHCSKCKGAGHNRSTCHDEEEQEAPRLCE
ncbi:Protein FAR1-RELATED SEQUENCE 4 [Linum perenne]